MNPGDGSRKPGGGVRFTSYYGQSVLKPPVWKEDIAYYFFLGGLAAGSSVLATGADRTDRTTLRRGTRVGAAGAISLGTVFLVKDLGRPERFHHMLRVAKLTSPMSVGTWILTVYAPLAGLVATAELLPGPLRRTAAGRLLLGLAPLAGWGAALLAPAVASYTAVLISDTAIPAWHEGRHILPFVFTGSAAASAGGLGMLLAPVTEAGPARRFAQLGATVELVASRALHGKGRAVEPYQTGKAGVYEKRATALTAIGMAGSLVLARRSRVAAIAAGAALLAGSLYQRLGVFEAGVASAQLPPG